MSDATTIPAMRSVLAKVLVFLLVVGGMSSAVPAMAASVHLTSQTSAQVRPSVQAVPSAAMPATCTLCQQASPDQPAHASTIMTHCAVCGAALVSSTTSIGAPAGVIVPSSSPVAPWRSVVEGPEPYPPRLSSLG